MFRIYLNLRGLFRDRFFYAVFLTAFFLIVLIPAFSNFSMRQVQELSLSLALSTHSAFLLILAILLGTSSLWRDIERRFIHSVLSLPLSRGRYLLEKFVAVAVFMLLCSVILALAAAVAVVVASASYPSAIPVNWLLFLVAIAADYLKSLLIVALALLFSTLATSFYLPFFVSLALYLCGSASQQVYEYINSSTAEKLSSWIVLMAQVFYYLLPNFTLFDFKVQAIYSLPLDTTQLFLAGGYFVVYGSLIMIAAIVCFTKRQLL